MESNAKRLPGTMNVFGAETAAFPTRHEFKAFRRRWSIRIFEMQMAEKPSRNNTKLSVKDSRRLITLSPDETDSFQIASTDDLSEVCRPATKEDNRYSALKTFLLASDLKVR